MGADLSRDKTEYVVAVEQEGLRQFSLYCAPCISNIQALGLLPRPCLYINYNYRSWVSDIS